MVLTVFPETLVSSTVSPVVFVAVVADVSGGAVLVATDGASPSGHSNGLVTALFCTNDDDDGCLVDSGTLCKPGKLSKVPITDDDAASGRLFVGLIDIAEANTDDDPDPSFFCSP